MTSEPRDDGFTLVEVLVALAIAALALGVFYDAVGNSLVRSKQAAFDEETILLSQGHLARIGIDIELRQASGHYQNGASFEMQIASQSLPAGSTMSAVPVTVVLDVRDLAGRQVVRLETIKLRPRSP